MVGGEGVGYQQRTDRERCGSSLIFQNVPHVKPVGERQRGNKEIKKRERERERERRALCAPLRWKCVDGHLSLAI